MLDLQKTFIVVEGRVSSDVFLQKKYLVYSIVYQTTKKNRSNYLVVGPGAQKILRLSSRTQLGYLLTFCPGHV